MLGILLKINTYYKCRYTIGLIFWSNKSLYNWLNILPSFIYIRCPYTITVLDYCRFHFSKHEYCVQVQNQSVNTCQTVLQNAEIFKCLKQWIPKAGLWINCSNTFVRKWSIGFIWVQTTRRLSHLFIFLKKRS